MKIIIESKLDWWVFKIQISIAESMDKIVFCRCLGWHRLRLILRCIILNLDLLVVGHCCGWHAPRPGAYQDSYMAVLKGVRIANVDLNELRHIVCDR